MGAIVLVVSGAAGYIFPAHHSGLGSSRNASGVGSSRNADQMRTLRERMLSVYD